MPQVLRKLKIRQSAAQMWCFVRHFPLLVGRKIPYNDEKWECLLLLRDMLFYVCAPSLGRGHILAMSDIIQEFHECYRTCFPEESVKPKFHYTLHYPHLTTLFGPLIHMQTLRFEGKHNYFKELVYRSKNRKNMCKSLAERHQYYQCTFNTGGKFLFDGEIGSTGGSSLPIRLLNNQFYQLLVEMAIGEQIFTCKSVKYYGVTYWKDTCVVTGLQGFDYQFCKIIHCAVIHGVPFLLCQKLRTLFFERHFHAFAVTDTPQYEIHKISDLPETNPLGIYDHPHSPIVQHKLVVPKYKILC